MGKMHTEKKTNWNAVIVFYVLACLISWPFFWWRDMNPDSWAEWRIPSIVKTWTYMWGPGIAVILTLLIYKHRLKMEPVGIFGKSVVKSLLFWFVPFMMLCVPGVPNNWNMNPHLFPLISMGCLGFISIVGEDSGWSYFLKNVLIKVPAVYRCLIIGTLWELWHFTNRTAHKAPFQAIFGVLIMVIVVSVLTFIMSKITDKTQSLVTAVTIHMWLNVLTENGCTAVYTVFALSIIFWIFMYLTWDKSIVEGTKVNSDLP